jgi:hypothetical protein
MALLFAQSMPPRAVLAAAFQVFDFYKEIVSLRQGVRRTF